MACAERAPCAEDGGGVERCSRLNGEQHAPEEPRVDRIANTRVAGGDPDAEQAAREGADECPGPEPREGVEHGRRERKDRSAPGRLFDRRRGERPAEGAERRADAGAAGTLERRRAGHPLLHHPPPRLHHHADEVARVTTRGECSDRALRGWLVGEERREDGDWRKRRKGRHRTLLGSTGCIMQANENRGASAVEPIETMERHRIDGRSPLAGRRSKRFSPAGLPEVDGTLRAEPLRGDPHEGERSRTGMANGAAGQPRLGRGGVVTAAPILYALLVLAVTSVALFVARGCVVVVERGTARVVDRLGRFHRVAGAGVHLRLPILEAFGPPIDLEVRHQDVRVETLTEDGVFVDVIVAVQFFAVQAQLSEAGYRASEVGPLVARVVEECLRERIPTLRMDTLHLHRRAIADDLVTRVTPALALVGYEILRVTVTDIRPDAGVRAAIAELQASQRVRAAAAEHGAAQRLLEVQAAETRAECEVLKGRGIADKRHAILLGLRDSIDDLRRVMPGASLAEVMDLIVAAQYLDTLREVGASAHSKVVFLPSPARSGESTRAAVPRVAGLGPALRGDLVARATASG